MSHIVIGIPTYRRPQVLRRLLATIAEQVQENSASLVVADNACSSQVAEILATFGRQTGCRYVYLPVPERGISQARNGLVAATETHQPDWDWLVMLDDDALATPGWLAELIRIGEQLKADIVGGPVLGDLPESAGRLARNSLFAGRPRHPTGRVSSLFGTQNIAVSRRLCDRLERPWFRSDLGLSGGEDYEFFRRAISAGAVLGWADSAAVYEPTEAARLTPRAVMMRYASTGMSSTRIELLTDTRARIGRRWAMDAYWVARGTAAAMVRRDLDGLAKTCLGATALAGRLAGFTGMTASRYRDAGHPTDQRVALAVDGSNPTPGHRGDQRPASAAETVSEPPSEPG